MRQRDVPVSRRRVAGNDSQRLSIRRTPDYKIGALALMAVALGVHIIVWLGAGVEPDARDGDPSAIATILGWLILGGASVLLMRAGIALDLIQPDSVIILRRGLLLRRARRIPFSDARFQLKRGMYFNESDFKSQTGVETLEWDLLLSPDNETIRLDGGADADALRALARTVADFSGCPLDDLPSSDSTTDAALC